MLPDRPWVPVLVRLGGIVYTPDGLLECGPVPVPALDFNGLEATLPMTLESLFARMLELSLMLVAAAGGSGSGRGVEIVL